MPGGRRYKAMSVAEVRQKYQGSKLRARYSKLAWAARQRVGAFTAMGMGNAADLFNFAGFSDFMDTRGKAYRFLGELKGISERELALRVSRLSKFLANETSRPEGLKQSIQDTVDRLSVNYGDIINEKNVLQFFQFMEDARARGLATLYPSDVIVELFSRSQKRGLTREQILGNMNYWKEHGPAKPRFDKRRKASSEDF